MNIIMAALIGLFIGSFIGVEIRRLTEPSKQTVDPTGDYEEGWDKD